MGIRRGFFNNVRTLMDTLTEKRQRAANTALLTLMQQQLPQNAFGEYLLALAESDLGATGEAEAMPALLPAPLLPPVPTPDASVETVPEFLVAGAEAPEEAFPSGESAKAFQRPARTPRQKAKTPPPSPSATPVVSTAPAVSTFPAPARKPRNRKGAAEPVQSSPEEAEDFDGRAAAQRYIEECLKESKGVNRTLVGQYLGTSLFSEINRFVVVTQDAYRERNNLRQNGDPRQSKGKEARIEANFARLAQAIHGSDDEEEDDEPSDAEMRAIQKKADSKPGCAGTPYPPKQPPNTRGVPRWWADGVARYCPGCHMLIQPRHFPANNAWETQGSYEKRKSCGRDCPKTAGK